MADRKTLIDRTIALGAGATGGVVANLTWPALVDFVKSLVYDMVCR